MPNRVRNPWHCIFCKTKAIRERCQDGQPCHQESEVLKRKMLPKEQLVSVLMPLLLVDTEGHSLVVDRVTVPKANPLNSA
jgi:hypothetical protein